jgi:sporulation protein YlmC with PRC-barrel domain
MEIPIRAKVQCSDGPGGEATHVIIRPATRTMTQVVVKEARSPHVERLVPFRFVKETTADQIRLRCSRQEMSNMQPFVRTELIEASVPTGWVEAAWSYEGHMPIGITKVKRLNIAEDELAMDTDTRVRVTDGKAGRIDELMVDPASGSITDLLLRKGPVWAPRGVAVPMSEVDRIGERAITLRMDRAGMAALPAMAARRR